MSPHDSKSKPRMQFLAFRHEIAMLYKQGFFAKDIHKLVGLQHCMSYCTFARFFRLLIKKPRKKTMSSQLGRRKNVLVAFKASLSCIRQLSQQGYNAKAIFEKLGLDDAMSYPSFARYYALYCKSSYKGKEPIDAASEPNRMSPIAPSYDPQLKSKRVQRWAPPDPWPHL